MGCTVTVDMSGLLTRLDTMNTTLNSIQSDLAALAAATALGDLATLLTGSGSPLATLASAIVSGVLQAAFTGSSSPATSIDNLRKALVPDGYTLTLSERIAADKSPSLAQRILQADNDPMFTDLGALADRIAPLPTDVQCDAVDDAWSTQPTTDNLADNIESLQFGAQPYTP
jgi:hypothetical protein